MTSGRHRILYVQYTNPAAYPPLEHSAHLLARDGWRVLMLGIEVAGVETLRLAQHPQLVERRLGVSPQGWCGHLHYLGFCLWVVGWTWWWRPTWLYASDALACLPALLARSLPGLRILYHEHDAPATAPRSAGQRLVAWARRRAIRRADLCVAPNAQRLARLTEETGRRQGLFGVWNCPAREEAAAPRAPDPRSGLRVLYYGSVTPARLPLAVLHALAQLPDAVHLHVLGYETSGHHGYMRQLLDTAARLGIAHRITCTGASRRAALLEHARQCDVGFAALPLRPADANLQDMVGASNKSFEYLACQLPLLVSDLPGWRTLFVEPGYGLACDPESPDSVARALRWCLDHPAETRAMGERGRQRILDEWHYERQFAPVLARLAAVP